jgi:hypothetical protein
MLRPLVSFRVGSFTALVFGVVWLAGCTPPPAPCFAVSGKVTLQKKPLTSGNIRFIPDSGKGNNSKESAFGFIDHDGSYTLTTNGRDGAPLGWYKVSVDPLGMPKEFPPSAGNTPIVIPKKESPGAASKGPPINPKYKSAETSGISVEVKENASPGAYDIELK